MVGTAPEVIGLLLRPANSRISSGICFICGQDWLGYTVSMLNLNTVDSRVGPVAPARSRSKTSFKKPS
jgi:hypothetical protein